MKWGKNLPSQHSTAHTPTTWMDILTPRELARFSISCPDALRPLKCGSFLPPTHRYSEINILKAESDKLWWEANFGFFHTHLLLSSLFILLPQLLHPPSPTLELLPATYHHHCLGQWVAHNIQERLWYPWWVLRRLLTQDAFCTWSGTAWRSWTAWPQC